jgi:pimeloyl-ACP methyl ester carboxylesterase
MQRLPTIGGRRRRSARRRRVALVAGLGLAACAVLLVVDAVRVERATKPAVADIGTILRLRGGDLQVRTDGPRGGTPIVLIHRLASSMHEWDAIVPELARDHRVIRVDLLGHGGSDKPRRGYSIENQARLLGEALRRLQVLHALVVGHSMGGAVAVALAEADPQAVGRLVLMDSNDRSRFFHLPTLSVWAPRPLIGELLWSFATDSMIRNGFKVMFAPGHRVPTQAVTDLRRMTYTAYTASLRDFERYLDRRGLDLRLAKLQIPRLVIWGAHDQLVAPGALQLYRRDRGVHVVVFARSGHSPMLEQPALTAHELLLFARTHRPSRALRRAREKQRNPANQYDRRGMRAGFAGIRP